MNENIDIDIEKHVLGNLVSESQLIAQYYNILSPHLFSVSQHQFIYESVVQVWKQYGTVDLMLLGKEFEKRNLKQYLEYCIDLASFAVSSANIEYHIILLVQASVKRDFVLKFSSLLNMAQKNENDIFDIRDKAFEYFNNLFIDKFIENNRQSREFPELVNAVQKNFESIQQGKATGLQSSLSIINKVFGGWQNSNLTIVAGRPGMGKTTFLVQQIVDVVKQGLSVGVFSLEMNAEQITTKIISNYTSIPNSSLLRKGLKDDEITRYIILKERLLQMQVHIDETSSISIDNLKMKAKSMKLRHNISILFIDYLQLITYHRAGNREQEISLISRSLKGLAKELNIPVIALSQLSRGVEQRADKRPLLSDLRDSGAIEQDADEVIFLYRPEYYNIENWDKEYNNESTKNEIEIIISKNRHGGILSERCSVNMATSKFTDLVTI
nr:replicative DNA helicase [uncultured Capnocytophaga sp.]